MPIAIDSIGIETSHQNEFITSKRISGDSPFGRADLTPGSTYRVWAIAVNGDSSVMRFSRPPHRFIDIKVPELIQPIVEIDSLRIVSKSPEHVDLQWFTSDDVPILISIADNNSPIEMPESNAVYRVNAKYGAGDALQKSTYVVGNGVLNSIRIENLPLSRTWR